MLAANGTIDLLLLVLSILGIALIMAAACAYNNYIDRDIDSKMARTRNRSLVVGSISSKSAIIYGSILGLTGFAILLIFVNLLTALLGIFAFLYYLIIYGIAKRRTVYGTLVGSVAGAMPPVAGYTAVTNSLDRGALLLFLILIFWQMPHFYSIAIFRMKEYKSANLPLLPIVKGLKRTKVEIFIYIIAFIISTFLLFVYDYVGIFYVIPMVLVGIFWLFHAYKGFNVKNDISWSTYMFKLSLKILVVFSFLVTTDSFIN